METCCKPVNLRRFQFRVRYHESRFLTVTSKLSFVRENFILYKSALTLWTTFVTYSRSHSHDDLLQSDSLLFGCIHVSFGTLLKKISDYFSYTLSHALSHALSHWCFSTDSFDRSLLATVEFPSTLRKKLTVLYQHKHHIGVHSNGIHHQFQRIVCIEPELPKVQN